MSDFQKQLDKTARGIKMTAAEKRELKAQVVSYMEYHPRRETVSAQKAAAYIESQPYSIISIYNRYVQAAAGALAVLVFIVVPAIAERSVPGDVLYPIKVSVNEEVRSGLTFGATEKIEWETERLERRISEVRLLAEEGKLTEEAEAKAAEAVKEHAEAAQGEINKLKESDADAATLAEVEFESALEVQTAVLDSAEEEGDVAEATEVVSEVVKEAQEIVSEGSQGSAIPAYDRIAARLEMQTTRAYELFASLNDVASDEERAEIERRLEDIERKVAAGTEAHAADGVVPDELLEALSDIQKLISFMTDIDVRASVELEELVPVELTDEEKIEIVASQVVAAEEILARYAEAASADIIEPEALVKIEVAVANVRERMAQIIGDNSDPVPVETQVQNGNLLEDLVEDIGKMLTAYSGEAEVPAEEVIEPEAENSEEVVEEKVSEEETLTEEPEIEEASEVVEEEEVTDEPADSEPDTETEF